MSYGHEEEQDTAEVTVILKRQTERAILVSDEDNEFWIAISQVSDLQVLKQMPEGTVVTIAIPMWLAENNGLA